MLSPKAHLHIFTSPRSSTPSTTNPPSSSLNSMKTKALIHNLLFSHICRLLRSLSKLKSLIVELCHEARVLYLQDSGSELTRRKKKMNKYRKKILFGSFRLHYNWCSSSSHVLPINYNYYSSSPSGTTTTLEAGNDSSSGARMYYDSTWNSVFSTDGSDYKSFDETTSGVSEVNNQSGRFDDGASQLSSYLEWLEEEGKKKISNEEVEKEKNEIDMLADMFIANCHEKFRLEKIESYRRYQEMLARSV